MRSIGLVAMNAPNAGFGEGLGGFARRLWWERRLRARFFPAEIFGEPAWDLLLDVYASSTTGKRTRIGEAYIGAGVPPNVAIRSLDDLVERRILSRDREPPGGRARSTRLTAEAASKMAKLLAEVNSYRRGCDDEVAEASKRRAAERPVV